MNWGGGVYAKGKKFKINIKLYEHHEKIMNKKSKNFKSTFSESQNEMMRKF